MCERKVCPVMHPVLWIRQRWCWFKIWADKHYEYLDSKWHI